MIIIIFSATASVLTAAFLIKSGITSRKQRPSWLPVINDFKQKSSKIQTYNMLEEYLVSISNHVNQYQTDVDFLVSFNNQIRKVRSRIQARIEEK